MSVDSENRIRLIVDGDMAVAKGRAVRAALSQYPLLAVCEADKTAVPSLVICLGWHWSPSLVDLVLQQVRNSQAPVIVAVGESPTLACADTLLRAGVWNVLSADDPATLAASVADCADRLRSVETALSSKAVRLHLVGTSPTWRAFLRELVWASQNSSAWVLLSGETGTGKELLARLVHTLDNRPGKCDLVVVDCTTLSTELAASELFGHERGAFTGAHSARTGAAALANGGTLFLDEVGELPLPVQAQLLRLLQEGSYKTVGGSQWKRSAFRLVCATHRNLEQAVAEGRFRQDLFFRISGWTAVVPPLRERSEDIPALATHFLREFGCEQGIDVGVASSLQNHAFEGNVRELRQLMMQSAVKHCGKTPVSLGDLPLWWHRLQPAVVTQDSAGAEALPDGQAAQAQIAHWLRSGMGLREVTQLAGDLAIREALAMEGQHVGKAARRLGVTERAIQLRKAQRPETCQR